MYICISIHIELHYAPCFRLAQVHPLLYQRPPKLIRMLLPQVRLPTIEVLGGGVAFQPQPGQHPDGSKGISFSAELFIEPLNAVSFHLSQHRCKVEVLLGEHNFVAPATAVALQSMHVQQPQAAGIGQTAAGLYVQGPGSFAIHTKVLGSLPDEALGDLDGARVRITFGFGAPVESLDATVSTGRLAGNRMLIAPGTRLTLIRH